jgi:hypothetical protein
MDRFVRFGLWSGAVGGVLLVAGAGLAWAMAAGRPLSTQALTTAFVMASVLRLAGAMAMLLGITGLVAGASARGGRMLYVGYALCVVDLFLQAGWMFTDLFLSDTMARRAPDVLDGTASSSGRLDQGSLLAWVLNLAFVVLALVLWRTRTYPRTTWIALLVGGALTVVPLPIDGMGYEVLIGVCFAVALVSALRSQGRVDISESLGSAATRTTAAVD